MFGADVVRTGAHLRVSDCDARSSHRKAKAMQVPSILQGESRTRLFQGIAIGAVAAIFVGFFWGGWVTGGSAKEMAQKSASSAVTGQA